MEYITCTDLDKKEALRHSNPQLSFVSSFVQSIRTQTFALGVLSLSLGGCHLNENPPQPEIYFHEKGLIESFNADQRAHLYKKVQQYCNFLGKASVADLDEIEAEAEKYLPNVSIYWPDQANPQNCRVEVTPAAGFNIFSVNSERLPETLKKQLSPLEKEFINSYKGKTPYKGILKDRNAIFEEYRERCKVSVTASWYFPSLEDNRFKFLYSIPDSPSHCK